MYLYFPPPGVVVQASQGVERRPYSGLVTALDTEEMKMKETLPVLKEIKSAVKKQEEWEGCHLGGHKEQERSRCQAHGHLRSV